MPHLYEPWKRHRRQSSHGADDARHEVDDLLHARNPNFGMMPQGVGHRLRMHARRSLHEGAASPNGGEGVRHSVLGIPSGLALVLMVFGALLVIGWAVWIIYYGFAGGSHMLLTVLMAAGAGVLVMAGVLLLFMALIVVLTSPARLVAMVRRVVRRA